MQVKCGIVILERNGVLSFLDGLLNISKLVENIAQLYMWAWMRLIKGECSFLGFFRSGQVSFVSEKIAEMNVEERIVMLDRNRILRFLNCTFYVSKLVENMA